MTFRESYVLAVMGAAGIFVSIPPWLTQPTATQKWIDAFFLSVGVGLIAVAIIGAIAAIPSDMRRGETP